MLEDASRAIGSSPVLRGVRILFVLPSLGVGGAERQAFLLARHLARNEGACVEMVAFGGAGETAEECARENIAWSRFRLAHEARGRLWQLVDVARFAAFLRHRRAQILLPYCMFQNVFAGLTWRLGGANLCLWNQRDEGRARIERRIERAAVRRISCFISNSLHGAEFLTGTLGVAPERVHVIHNGVEPRVALATRGEWRRRLNLPQDSFVACMVANLHRYKDHPTLLVAWREVVDRLDAHGQAAHLILAGRPADRYAAVMQQTRELALGGRVHVIGETPDIGGLLGAVDLAVFSSYAEGVPNAVLEALVAGVPVVGTDYAGIREAVGPSGFELLAKPRDPHDLAEKVVALALDADRRARAGRSGRAWAAETFGLERMCRETVARLITEWRVASRARRVGTVHPPRVARVRGATVGADTAGSVRPSDSA